MRSDINSPRPCVCSITPVPTSTTAVESLGGVLPREGYEDFRVSTSSVLGYWGIERSCERHTRLTRPTPRESREGWSGLRVGGTECGRCKVSKPETPGTSAGGQRRGYYFFSKRPPDRRRPMPRAPDWTSDVIVSCRYYVSS